LGSGFRDVLAGADPAAASRRPEPAVWSPLEDACPVRDVVLVQRDPRGARVEDNPSFARMHRDERILLRRYDADALSDVLGQLATAAKLCATVFDGLHGTASTRRLVCNWPAAAGRRPGMVQSPHGAWRPPPDGRAQDAGRNERTLLSDGQVALPRFGGPVSVIGAARCRLLVELTGTTLLWLDRTVVHHGVLCQRLRADAR
jgi:hypothetical protein